MLLLSSVWLLACSPSEPPAPPAPPAPTGPVSVELTLDCPTPFGTFGLADLGAPKVGTPHPTPGAVGITATVGVDGHFAIALEEGPEGLFASIDVDGDGTIGPEERQAVDPDGGRPGARFELPARSRSGATAAVTVGVRSSIHPDGSRVLHLDQGCAARGTLPDGAPFGVKARSGLLDHDRTEVLLDLDGDGTVDFANRLASVRLAEGVVPWAGATWGLAFDGHRMVLTPTEGAVAGLRAGSPAPDFAAVGTDGQTHDLQRYRGQPLLLDFWATWCAPCIRAHPEVVALTKAHDLAVLGISADEDEATVQRWLDANPTPWPSVVQGPEGAINEAYGVNSWPSYALLDEDGRLVVLGELPAVKTALADRQRP